jgi:hypothetical protein
MSSVTKGERRHAPRLNVNIPTLVEVIGQRELQLHPNLAAVYERVRPPTDFVGKKFPGVLRDLSTNGAFISGEPLPLLSRLAFTFPLDGYGQAEVLGWVMWRRKDVCEIPRDGGGTLALAAGFGVLFEAIPLDARMAIAKLVSTRGSH